MQKARLSAANSAQNPNSDCPDCYPGYPSVTLDLKEYYIDNLGKLVGVLMHVIQNHNA